MIETVFSPDDRARISAAIVAAESRTAGEIVAVVAPESASYMSVPFMWAGLAALIVPWPLIFFTWWPDHWIYVLQLAVFAAVVLMLLYRPLRFALVPPMMKRERARQRASEQFLVQNLCTTPNRTGVLIYVSMAERFAALIADSGIDAKVEKGTWQRIIDELTKKLADNRPTEGFVGAIEAVGAELARHFPPGTGEPNRLPDHLIVLS